MAKKYYAVKKGRKTGVFETWDECKQSVSGFSGAAYKSFTTREEASAFVNGTKSNNDKEEPCISPATFLISLISSLSNFFEK